MMNIAMNPTAKYIGVLYWIDPNHIVPSQLKIFTPVGMAISMVDSAKKVSAIGPMPVVNMWWLHTPNPRKAMKTPENTRSEEHTSELQSLAYLVCRLLLEKKK